MSDANIGEGVLEVTADTKPAETAIAGLGRKVNKQADDLVAFGKKGLLATGILVAGLGAAGKAASDLNESVNAVAVTYGANAEGILKLGENAATAVGLSSSAFNGLAVQFSAFATTIAGKGGNVVKTIDDLTHRAADFASVMNIDVNEAARLFQSGLAGETEPLRKFGLDLSAAAVEAHAVAAGINDGTHELTEAEKVQSRYSLLMEQTAKTQGDFANTSDSAANAQRIATAELTNAAAQIGASVLPAFASLVGGVADAAKWIASMNEATGGAIAKFAMFGTAGLGIVSVVARVAGQLEKLRDRFTSVGADGTRSMTNLGKGLAAAGVIVGVATIAYGIYADEKRRAEERTAEFTAALEAEREGQQGAIDALIARKIAEMSALDIAKRAGITATDIAKAIRGEQVPALEQLNKLIGGNVDQGALLVARGNDIAEVFDLNSREALALSADIGRLATANREAAEAMATHDAVAKELAGSTGAATVAYGMAADGFHAGAEGIAGAGEVLGLVDGKVVDLGADLNTTAALEDAYAKRVDAAAESERRQADALVEVERAINAAREAVVRHIESLNEQIDTMRAAADATVAVQVANDQWATFLQGLDQAVKDAGGDQEELNAIYRDGTDRATEIADATARVYEEQLKSNGETLSATQRLDIFNGSMLKSAATATGPLRKGILDYLVQVNQIPADKVTALEMYVNAGLMEDAQRLIDETSAAREVAITADVNEASIDGVETVLGELTRPRFVKINGQFVANNQFARGTSYAPGGSALVGEEGAELIDLPRGARVHTASETRSILADRASWQVLGGAFPDELTLIVEGEPITARVAAHSRRQAAALTAGRRPG